MKNFHQRSISVQVTNVGVKTQRKTGETVPKKNPKINVRLLEEYERLIAASGGAIRTKKPGVDYHLSHPFGSNDVPTDPREIGKRLSDVKRT